MQTSTNNASALFSTWWNTIYMPMIENGDEIVKRLQSTETTLLHDKINTFVSTLDETIVFYYHITYRVFSPDSEFHAPSHIYVATTTNLYCISASLKIISDKATITTPNDFEKIISYSSLPSSTWDIISTLPPITTFLIPLEIENRFEYIYQKINDFKALFSTETQTQIPPPQ
jgi:hypothetical protein